MKTDPNNPATITSRIPSFGAADDDIRGLWASPNGLGLVIGNAVPGDNKFCYRLQYTSGFPDYTDFGTSIDSPTALTFGLWLDNTYFVGGSVNGLSIFQYDEPDLSLNYLMPLTDLTGTPVSGAATANGGRWMAIGFLDGSDYSAALYERVGPYPVYRQTIAGIGRTLGFTQDGQLLIDSTARKAYDLDDGVWVERAGALTNVVAGAIGHAVSPHIENPTGLTRLYDNRLADLQQGLIDFEDLWVTYLTPDAATFDPTDTTAAAVIGADEVTGGGWPAGGKQLQNVTAGADGTRRWRITADNVTHILFGTGASFRFALVYEKTTDKPLLFIDYQKTYAIPKNTQIELQFNPDGMIVYTD